MPNTKLSRKYRPITFINVSIEDIFWEPRQRANREHTIPIEYQQCRDTGRIDAFRLNWKTGMKPVPHIFWDSDVAKWIEAASYSLATHPDPQLNTLLDEVIALIASAQQPDGYLNTHFTVVEPEKRWTNLRDQHELYCAGHMIEAGVAHFQATGKRNLLDVVCHYVDHIASIFGTQPGQKRGYPGHEEIELALVKLYHATDERCYLDLSQYFIDERGKQPYYYDLESVTRGEDPKAYWAKTYSYMQAQIPVRQQSEVVGHAVRAMYLYSAMADLANETGDNDLLDACRALWRDVCLRKMYITGGIGPSRLNEGFTNPYDLPNETAYAETCAAVGLVFWNHRMLQFDCDGRYADIMERALYNGVISGVSLSGELFFYENPLASLGHYHREPWFDCACCPPNIARLLASLGQYVYSQNDDEAVVHLYIQGQGKFRLGEQPVVLRQETQYPWDGEVNIHLDMEQPTSFGLKLRLPGWCKNANLSVNGTYIPIEKRIERGYVCIHQVWNPGDMVQFIMDIPVERVYAHPEVNQDFGLVAIQRGPIVYCLEQVDHDIPVSQIILPVDSPLSFEFTKDLLGGMGRITGEALVTKTDDWKDTLYRPGKPGSHVCQITAIPYFAWDNRSPGPMRIWLPER